MVLQRTHGRLYPLVSPPDELPAATAERAAPVERRQDGRIASAEAARVLGKRGGLRSARRRQDAKAWGAGLGLGRLLATFKDDDAIAPFVREGEEWLGAQCVAVARDVGAGELSPGVVSILRTAAWERLYSAWLFDAGTRGIFAWDVHERDEAGQVKRATPRTDLLVVATRLGDASRQNLLAAHELASREAEARPKAAVDFAADMRRRILGESGK
jgi:hypothetical protein